jgi:hypothetical protein
VRVMVTGQERGLARGQVRALEQVLELALVLVWVWEWEPVWHMP